MSVYEAVHYVMLETNAHTFVRESNDCDMVVHDVDMMLMVFVRLASSCSFANYFTLMLTCCG